MADGAAADTARLDRAVARSGDVREIVVGTGTLAGAGRLWRRTIGAQSALIVADDNTWKAAGPAVAAALESEGIAHRRIVLPGAPRLKPDRTLGADLAGRAAPGEAFLALGAGVINDLTKYAAFTAGRPFLCVATAASMDGYSSAGAPLVDRGFKITIACRPAVAVLADLDIIAGAPAGMAGWGYGDMAGKIPAGADWIIADALGVEPVDDTAWPMVQDGVRRWLERPGAVAAGERGALDELFTGLALVGLAMEAHGSSRPASGADHQIAHLWEMEDLTHAGERVSHGACVAVGCLAALHLYDWLLARDLTTLDADALARAADDTDTRRARIEAAFDHPGIAARAAEETAAKTPDHATLQARLASLSRVWPDLRARLAAQIIPAGRMADMLRAAGAPAAPGDIGLSGARLRRSVAAARFLRRRYTVLDLLDDAGLLQDALDDCFGPDAEA